MVKLFMPFGWNFNANVKIEYTEIYCAGKDAHFHQITHPFGAVQQPKCQRLGKSISTILPIAQINSIILLYSIMQLE